MFSPSLRLVPTSPHNIPTHFEAKNKFFFTYQASIILLPTTTPLPLSLSHSFSTSNHPPPTHFFSISLLLFFSLRSRLLPRENPSDKGSRRQTKKGKRASNENGKADQLSPRGRTKQTGFEVKKQPSSNRRSHFDRT